MQFNPEHIKVLNTHIWQGIFVKDRSTILNNDNDNNKRKT